MVDTDIDLSEPAHARGATGDAALIRQMAAGDESALAALYDRWAPRLYAVAVQIVKQQDDAEDVLEDTIWQAWREAGSYAPSQGTVATWLLGIARARSLERLRSRQRPKDAVLETRYGEPGTASGRLPIHHVQAVEHVKRLAAALRELSQDQREAFELAYFHGLSQTEIADRTGEPLGTVKTRLRLAMQKLREQLVPVREPAETG